MILSASHVRQNEQGEVKQRCYGQVRPLILVLAAGLQTQEVTAQSASLAWSLRLSSLSKIRSW